MARSPILNQEERRQSVAAILRGVLSRYGLADAVNEHELQFRTQVIVENPGDRRLSDAILNAMFPRHETPAELFHYTTLAGLKGIAASRELRLYHLRKRIDQGELIEFARVHRLRGYLESTEGEPYYRELSDDIFYASFVSLDQRDEGSMWDLFAKGTGVRVGFRLEPKITDLRPIQYDAPFRTLLRELNDTLDAAGEPPFLPWTISRIGATYLPSTLRTEEEVRLMLKRYEPDQNEMFRFDGEDEYFSIPIGQENEFCRIEVVNITPGPSAQIADVQAAVMETGPFCASSTGTAQTGRNWVRGQGGHPLMKQGRSGISLSACGL